MQVNSIQFDISVLIIFVTHNILYISFRIWLYTYVAVLGLNSLIFPSPVLMPVRKLERMQKNIFVCSLKTNGTLEIQSNTSLYNNYSIYRQRQSTCNGSGFSCSNGGNETNVVITIISYYQARSPLQQQLRTLIFL